MKRYLLISDDGSLSQSDKIPEDATDGFILGLLEVVDVQEGKRLWATGGRIHWVDIDIEEE